MTTINDLEAVRKTLQKYEDGIKNHDISLLRSAFHEDAMMYGSAGGSVTVMEIEGLFDYVHSQQPISSTGEPHRCYITKIDVAGDAANAEVVQEHCFGVNYINYFHLIKSGAEWLIVSKTYYAVPVHMPAKTLAAHENM